MKNNSFTRVTSMYLQTTVMTKNMTYIAIQRKVCPAFISPINWEKI